MPTDRAKLTRYVAWDDLATNRAAPHGQWVKAEEAEAELEKRDERIAELEDQCDRLAGKATKYLAEWVEAAAQNREIDRVIDDTVVVIVSLACVIFLLALAFYLGWRYD